MARYVYRFAPGQSEGRAAMKELLGAKGARLTELARLGLPVPPGFVVTTEACSHYLRRRTPPAQLRDEIAEGIDHIETCTGRRFHGGKDPLLLSLRLAPPESMPGYSKTVLNLGLDDTAQAALLREGQEPSFVWQCHEQFLESYGRAVFNVENPSLSPPLRPEEWTRLTREQWQHRLSLLREKITELAGKELDPDPDHQLWNVVEAAFDSWKSPAMETSRRLHGIESGPGTALIVMAMVFGNRNDQSASGVCFTRHPASGEHRIYGEYLPRSQGTELVNGVTHPLPLRTIDRLGSDEPSFEDVMAEPYAKLEQYCRQLEAHFRDLQEIAFTVDTGRLWLLQCRRATRTGSAALTVAMDMIDENLFDGEEAILRIDSQRHMAGLFNQRIDKASVDQSPLFEGLAASPGAATGRLVMQSAEAVEWTRRQESVVLVRRSTSPDDLSGIEAAQALITTEGGLTSHAAEVAREVGIPCICGVRSARIAEDGSALLVGDVKISRGQFLTVDGTTGRAYQGSLPLLGPADEDDENRSRFFSLVDRHRRMEIYVDATDGEQVERATSFGADGVGRFRMDRALIEEPQRALAMRRLLLSNDERESRRAMNRLLGWLRDDGAQILRAARNMPVTFCLVDTPLRRFLPSSERELFQTASALEMDPADVQRQVAALEESNPLLGLRGSRLALVHPSIYTMQVRAIVEAARSVVDRGLSPIVEILLPRISDPGELATVADLVDQTVGRHLHGATERLHIGLGALIQVPRAALLADALARRVDFFLLDTVGLTGLSWGTSVDNAGRFMTTYLEKEIVSHDPFETLDRQGVGELVRIAMTRGRHEKDDLRIGIISEHAADPASIRYFESLDVDYLTVDADEIPATRLAAAQAYVAYERSLRQWSGPGQVGP